MRALEFLFILVLFVGLLLSSRLNKKNEVASIIFALAVMAIGILQVLVEGFRWQMAFAYLVCLSTIVPILLRRTSTVSNVMPEKKLDKFALTLLLLSLALSILVPIPILPAPEGKFQVGSKSFYLIDPKRREVFTTADEKRELMIQVWYPINPSSGNTRRTVPYMAQTHDFSAFFKSPLFAVAASHLHLINTHSVASAPISTAQESYPVLIFSHGLMGGRIQNTMQCENFASQGYIVVGIDHTYDSSFAVFPNKTVCSQLITRLEHGLPSIVSDGLEVRAADVEFVLGELQHLNEDDDILHGRLDFNRLGILGHSLGGQTALVVCARDKRFKAGLSMDGFVPVRPELITQPFMFIQADRKGDPFGMDKFCTLLRAEHYDLKLENSGHANFSDLPLLTPLHWVLGLSGSINGERAMRVIDEYSLAFFNRHLRGDQEELLDGPSARFPEIVFER